MEQISRTPRKLWLGLAVALIGSVAMLFATKPEPQAALLEQWSVQVNLATVKQTNVIPVERVVGRLKPARRAVLSFEAQGRVVERLVEPGARIEEGQVLARLASGDAQDRVHEADAQYQLEREAIRRDRELLKLAERNTLLQRSEVDRLSKLKAESLASKSQLDTARQALIQLQADEARLRHSVRTSTARLALRETQLSQAKRDLERTHLTAPFMGVVNSVEVEVGDYVMLDQPIAEIVDLESLELYAEVRGISVDALEPNQTLRVTIEGETIVGQLRALQYDPDPNTFTHALRIRLYDHRARPGMLASVELPRAPIIDALTVPVSAIASAYGKTFVLRYSDGVLRREPVTLGPRVGDAQVVLQGLNSGDRVVARDLAGLNDGQRVDGFVETS